MKKEKLTLLSLAVLGVLVVSFVMLDVKYGFDIKYVEASSTGNIYFVGGLGPNNYTSIQGAIDNASDNDTVYVYNGTYYENVVINKSINLFGEAKSNTIIDGSSSGDVIRVIADWVNISGFTIRNSGSNWGDAGIDLGSSHNTISGNNVSLNKYDGIYLYFSSNNTVTGNTMSLNNGSGIELWFSCNNNIIGNNLSSNIFYGVLFVSSFNNSIIGNQISPNNYYGIYLSSSSDNMFYHNNLINNSDQAYDNGYNLWDNGYPSGGNYWSDFDEPSEGAYDNNSDGIVDSSYTIPGGGSQDRYPLMYPWDFTPTQPTIVYVDRDFNLSTPGWGYDHFDKIQDGIDAVAENGTVYVFNGTYYEQVFITKTINFIGENQNVTIIDGEGSGDTVNITADWVNVSGFSIRNSGLTWADAGVAITSAHVAISKCYVYNCSYGIFMLNSIYVKIDNSTFYSIKINGTGLYFSSKIDIVDCYINNTGNCGIGIVGSHDIHIKNCLIYNHSISGIYMTESTNISIENCDISDNNDYYGVYIDSSYFITVSRCNLSNSWKGVYLLYAANNTLIDNVFYNNQENAICAAYSGFNTIQDSIIVHSLEEGLHFNITYNNTLENCTIKSNKHGIRLSSSYNNSIRSCILSNTKNNIVIDNGFDNLIENCEVREGDRGIYLFYESSKNTILNCNILNNNYGIWMEYLSNFNKITSSIITNNIYGIHMIYSADNHIANCTLYANYDGIMSEYSSNNTISRCNIYSNDDNGIWLEQSSNNTILNCSILSNYRGIGISHSSSNTAVLGNTISNNDNGISLLSSDNNTIWCNDIANNDKGIYVSSSNNNILSGNTISTQWDGIGLLSSSNNTISNTTIRSSNRWGIYLWDSSNNNIIIDNDISNNFDAMWLYKSKNNIVHYNNIHENAGYGIYNDNSEDAYIVNASYNYWGFPSGPYHPALNPDGTGEDISDNVDFIPWLTARIKGRKEEILTPGENEINAIRETDTTLEINTTANNSIKIISYEEAPVEEPDGIKSIGKYVEIEVENETTVQFPICIHIYYTQVDLDNAGMTERQILGIYFYNESSEDWALFNDTGINTTDIVVDGKQYEGYAWANAWHLTTLTIAGDTIKPEISNVEAYPQRQEINEYVNISCVVTDNIEVSEVFANILYPDESYQNFSMINIAETNIYYSYEAYFLKGSYEYFIWANDTSGNANASLKKGFSIGIPQYTLTYSADPTNAGTITLTPSGGTYDEGTVVTVTANANAGFVFNYWSGDSSSITDSIHITMDSNKIVTAHFSSIQPHYSLTASVSPPEGGSVNPSSGTYMEGTVVTVTAYTNSGYGFTHWSGDASGTSQSIQITMDSDKTITAHFNEIIEYMLTASVNPSEGGSVTLSPSGGVYNEGTVVTITAVANVSYEFNHWSGDASGENISIQITMDNNRSITAHFTAINHRPTVSIISPLNGTEVKKTITIHGVASDADGDETIEKVEIKIGDEEWTVINETASWNFSWDTTSLDNGDYILQARAYDGFEYSNIVSITVKVKNKEDGGGIPGFEMIAVVIAIGLLVRLRRKKQ